MIDQPGTQELEDFDVRNLPHRMAKRFSELAALTSRVGERKSGGIPGPLHRSDVKSKVVAVMGSPVYGIPTTRKLGRYHPQAAMQDRNLFRPYAAIEAMGGGKRDHHRAAVKRLYEMRAKGTGHRNRRIGKAVYVLRGVTVCRDVMERLTSPLCEVCLDLRRY